MAIYDTIGRTYSRTRQADPRIVEQISTLLGLPAGARLADIGAGTGNYTNAFADAGFDMHAVEPSAEMRAQARPHQKVVWFAGTAEAIPLADNSVAGVVCTLASHHFPSLAQAAAEFHRICANGPVVVLTIDPRQSDDFWFSQYFPEIHERDFEAFPPIAEVAATLSKPGDWRAGIAPYRMPADPVDRFMYAGWNHPELYLDDTFRANTSGFALADPEIVRERLARLRSDLDSGDWDRNHGHLRQQDSIDAGFRFVTCRAEA